MTTWTRTNNPAFRASPPRLARHRWPLAAVALAVAAAIDAAPASAGQIGNVDLVTRADGRVLPIHDKDGRRWVVGTPGQEYAIRVCNTTGGRVLAVMSVDGVNVVSGETASPSQSGYVLDAYECTDINGWRKNLASINAFYFAELPDSYAARTGDRTTSASSASPSSANARSRSRGGTRRRSSRRAPPPSPPRDRKRRPAAWPPKTAADAARRSQADSAGPAPAPMAKVGTGYGRNEHSYVQTTRFERESATPNETIAINYDRRENLIAMGILPPPSIARSSNPFPAWTPRFVPAPPPR